MLVIADAQLLELVDVLQRPKFADEYGVGISEVTTLVRRIEDAASFVKHLSHRQWMFAIPMTRLSCQSR